jgi:hypothetical protein
MAIGLGRRPRHAHRNGAARPGPIVVILTLAVVTAQVSSTFADQAARRPAAVEDSQPQHDEVTLTDLADRLARIEALISSRDSGPGQTTGE